MCAQGRDACGTLKETNDRGSDMGNSIPFPKNYTMYVLQAVRFLETGFIEEAEQAIENAYAIEQTRTAIILYATILAEQGKIDKAHSLAEKHQDVFEETPEHQLFYLTLLKKQQLFLQAETLMKKWETHQPALKESAGWIELAHTLSTEKDAYEHEQRQQQKKRVENFQKLGEFNREQQMSLLQEASHIPRRLFQQIARSLLVHPYVANESRTILLHILREQGATGSFQMLWFDEIKEVKPQTLEPLDEMTLFKQVHTLLEEQLEKNPSLLAMIQQEVDRHLLRVYPFLEEVITDPVEWTSYYLAAYYGEVAIEEGRLSASMKAWFDQLTREPEA